ncbi:MAG: hypothetical protein JNG84_03495 [Archangium sp.]|nr:hypothetical protein [Archangium sp.]
MMTRVLAAAVVVGSAAVWAQEIGTEIEPATPSSGVPTRTSPNDNPYAPNTPPPQQAQPSRGFPEPMQPVQRGGNGGARGVKPVENEGPAASAGSGAVGIRAGFGTTGVGIPSGVGAVAALAAPTVGLALWANDNAAITIDLGAALGIVSSATLFSLSAALGLDYHFRTPSAALRPLFTVGASFTMATTGGDPAIGLGFRIGGGAAYFFSPSFSLTGKLALEVPLSFTSRGDVIVVLSTLTPGVGAAWYF